MGAFGVNPHSAETALWLEHAGRRYPLAEVGVDFVVPLVDDRLEPCRALLRLVVDGREHLHPVELVEGLRGARRDTPIVADADLPF